ncbi:hypothetical protein GCM10027446_01500 [Angustibacter peucedani]
MLLFGLWLMLAASPLLRPWEQVTDADLENVRIVPPESCGFVCSLRSTDKNSLIGAALLALGLAGLGFSGWSLVAERRSGTSSKPS